MYWPEFLAIAIAHLFAVASPCPDFAVVTGQCVTGGARAGLWTSLGVGTGKLVRVAYCMLGVAVLLAQSPVLFTIMKCVAATYLLVFLVQTRHGNRPHSAGSPDRLRWLAADGQL